MYSIFASIMIHFLNPFLMFFQVQLKMLLLELNDKKIPMKISVGVKSIRHYVKIFGFFNNCKTQFTNGWEKMTIKNEILHHKNQSL